MSQANVTNHRKCNTLTEQEPGREFTVTIRKIYPIGKSFALNLPARWIRRNGLREIPYCTVRITDDDRLIIAPIGHAKEPRPHEKRPTT